MNNQKKYTLTIYVAGAGTPLLKNGKPWMENGKQLTSDPGHVFYGISEDGGQTIKAYGFAPPHVLKSLAGLLLTSQARFKKMNIKFIASKYIEKR